MRRRLWMLAFAALSGAFASFFVVDGSYFFGAVMGAIAGVFVLIFLRAWPHDLDFGLDHSVAPCRNHHWRLIPTLPRVRGEAPDEQADYSPHLAWCSPTAQIVSAPATWFEAQKTGNNDR